jgi:His/Glu/Gln/Arg/opine family amino acid ABC transporter permease subunit
MIEIILQYKLAFWHGLLITLKIVALSWVLGIFFGILIGILCSEFKYWIGKPFTVLAFILSSIPVLVLLFWFHFPFQDLIHKVIDPFWTIVFVLALVNTFLTADLIRSTLNNFPKEYIESAKVLHLTRLQTFKKIQLPIILKSILPSLLTIQVNILHLSLFGSFIAVPELFRVAQDINSQIYKPVEIYSFLALFFLFILLPINILIYYLKKKYLKGFLHG